MPSISPTPNAVIKYKQITNHSNDYAILNFLIINFSQLIRKHYIDSQI